MYGNLALMKYEIEIGNLLLTHPFSYNIYLEKFSPKSKIII